MMMVNRKPWNLAKRKFDCSPRTRNLNHSFSFA
jgi:hypothetical protein